MVLADLGEDGLTEELALADYNKPEELQSNYMYCLCYERFWESLQGDESVTKAMS